MVSLCGLGGDRHRDALWQSSGRFVDKHLNGSIQPIECKPLIRMHPYRYNAVDKMPAQKTPPNGKTHAVNPAVPNNRTHHGCSIVWCTHKLFVLWRYKNENQPTEWKKCIRNYADQRRRERRNQKRSTRNAHATSVDYEDSSV